MEMRGAAAVLTLAARPVMSAATKGGLRRQTWWSWRGVGRAAGRESDGVGGATATPAVQRVALGHSLPLAEEALKMSVYAAQGDGEHQLERA